MGSSLLPVAVIKHQDQNNMTTNEESQGRNSQQELGAHTELPGQVLRLGQLAFVYN